MPLRGRAGAISDGENNEEGAGEDKDEGEDEDEGEDDDGVYGEDDDRGGDRAVHFTKRFDPENALDVDWSDFKYPVARHFLTRFREAHAIATMFHLNEELAAKYPILNGQINAGWLAHYKRPIHVDQILQPTTTGQLGWDQDEVDWLVQTVRFYVSSISEAQRDEKGNTPERARQILKTRKERRALLRAPGFLFAVRAAAADGRNPAAVTAGYASCSRGARTTPRPQESGRHDIAVDDNQQPPVPKRFATHRTLAAQSAPPPQPCTVRTPAAPPPHPHRTVRILTASPPLSLHPGRAAGRAKSAAPGVG